MGTPTTFIKLDRNILSWGWFSTPATLSVWLFILIKANISDRKFQGVPVRRGELVTSYNSIAEACGLSYAQARTAVKHLVDTGEISTKNHNRYLLIHIVNYDLYQQNTAQSHGNDRPETAVYSHFRGIASATDTAKTQSDDTQMTHRTQTDNNTIRNKEIKKEVSV